MVRPRQISWFMIAESMGWQKYSRWYISMAF
jgi:hypothetical protein